MLFTIQSQQVYGSKLKGKKRAFAEEIRFSGQILYFFNTDTQIK